MTMTEKHGVAPIEVYWGKLTFFGKLQSKVLLNDNSC